MHSNSAKSTEGIFAQMRLRSIASAPYHAAQRLWLTTEAFLHPRSVDQIHGYWKKPDERNKTEWYLEGRERSEYLARLLSRHLRPDAAILEIGCNVGRNLHFLLQAGFTNLTGIEINADAIALLRKTFPDVAKRATLLVSPVERILPTLGNFDCVYTMAVLMHIHPESEGIVFPEMAKRTKLLVTIEEEVTHSWRSFPRDYRQIFEQCGMTQIEEPDCRGVGLTPEYRARVFRAAHPDKTLASSPPLRG
jgi:SAM-dependent methyltransferase